MPACYVCISQRLMDYINSHPELKAKVCGLTQLAQYYGTTAYIFILY